MRLDDGMDSSEFGRQLRGYDLREDEKLDAHVHVGQENQRYGARRPPRVFLTHQISAAATATTTSTVTATVTLLAESAGIRIL